MNKLFKFGIPAGGELFFNVFLFNIFLQLMHSFSADVAAAVTITLNYDMLVFIPMLGLGAAVTSMAGQQMGAGSIEGTKKVTRLATTLGFTYGGLMLIVFLAFSPSLVKLFSTGFQGGDQNVLPLATKMLRLVSIYILADATQLIFAGILRGAGDTRWVMFLSMTIHLTMAIGSFLMVKVFHSSAMEVWYLFIAIVIALGVVMFLRYLSGGWQSIKMIESDESL